MQIKRTKNGEPRARSSRGLTLFAAMSLASLLGALFGALCCVYMDSSLADILSETEESLLNVRREGDLTRILFTSLSSTGVYLLAAFLLGFSAIAQPAELMLPFLRGMGGGVILVQAYGESLSKATAIKAAVIFPGVFISLLAVILAAREALLLSNRLLSIVIHDKLFDGLLNRTKLYITRFVGLLALTSVGAAIDTALAMLLLGRL